MTDLPHGAITMADLYQAIMAMKNDLTRSLAKLEVIESRNTDADRLHTDHESRLRALEGAVPRGLEARVMALEKFRYLILGALVVIQALGVVIQLVITGRK